MKRILFFVALGAFCTKVACMDPDSSRKNSFSSDLMLDLDAIGGRLDRLERTGSSPVGLDSFVGGVSPITSHELVARLVSIQATQAKLAKLLEDLTSVRESIPHGGRARALKKLGLQDVKKRFMELGGRITDIAEILEPQTCLVKAALSAPVTPRVVSQEPHEFVDVVRLDDSEDQHSSDGEVQPDGQTRVYVQAEAIGKLAASLHKQYENQKKQRMLALQRRARSVPASIPVSTVNADDALTVADEEQAGVAK